MAGSSVSLGLVGADVDKDNELAKGVSYIEKRVVVFDLVGDEVERLDVTKAPALVQGVGSRLQLLERAALLWR